MAKSRAGKDKSAVEEALRSFGFTDEGVETILAFEEAIAEGVEAKEKAAPVEQATLDFGDWA